MLDKLTKNNRMRIRKIRKIEKETPTIKTFYFKDDLCAKAEPGQFVMLWIPGIDEIPLSLSGTYLKNEVSVTVAKVGEATSHLHQMKVNDFIGIRGPFGNSFKISKGKVLLVGGGTGIAPLAFLAQKLVKTSQKIKFLMGAKTKSELLFLERIKKILGGNGKVVATTEDGSFGFKGKVLNPLEHLLKNEDFDIIYTCGPEQMIKHVLLTAQKYGIEVQASLERIMRCAIGICGSCVIGKYRVCKDGPVFSKSQLEEMLNELAIFKRNFDGTKEKI